jgi:exportin-2 (importin alpha re-exporter)
MCACILGVYRGRKAQRRIRYPPVTRSCQPSLPHPGHTHSQDQIKALLPGLMLSTPALVQAQLSEALSIICSHDFPRQWPTLLGELVERLKTSDLKSINGVLATANSIFKRYR